MTPSFARRSARAALLAVAIAATAAAHAQQSAPNPECERLQRAVEEERRLIDAARKLLSPAEAHCAFANFAMPVTGDCAQVMEAAQANPEKRRAWSDALAAWSRLDTLMLAARRLEDRLGIACVAR